MLSKVQFALKGKYVATKVSYQSFLDNLIPIGPFFYNFTLITDIMNIICHINCHITSRSQLILNDGGWHHVCLTWSTSGDAQIYADGTLAQTTTSVSAGTSSLCNSHPFFPQCLSALHHPN